MVDELDHQEPWSQAEEDRGLGLPRESWGSLVPGTNLMRAVACVAGGILVDEARRRYSVPTAEYAEYLRNHNDAAA